MALWIFVFHQKDIEFYLFFLLWNSIEFDLGDENSVRDLINSGANVNLEDEGGSTALHFAVNHGNILLTEK